MPIDYEKKIPVTPLTSPMRRRMIEDMRLAGFAPTTQEHYLRHVSNFQRAFGKPAATASEEYVRQYLINCRNKFAPKTFNVCTPQA